MEVNYAIYEKVDPLIRLYISEDWHQLCYLFTKGNMLSEKKNNSLAYRQFFFFDLRVLMCKLDFINFVIFRNSGNEGSYPKLSWEKGRSL